MDPILVNFISLRIGALITWFGIFLSSKYSIRNQREQWDREHKAEQEKWLREKLQEMYSNCIYYTWRGHTDLQSAGPISTEQSQVAYIQT